MAGETTRVYDEAAARERAAAELPGWRVEGGELRRRYTTGGWRATVLLVNAIAYVAEAADHHPELAVRWAEVEVRLSTHDAGGITDRDYETARRIEETALWRPAPGSALRGPAEPLARGAEPAAG